MFILEELQGIFDPNGGTFKEGKYYHSFYAEVAETIERFFYDVGIMEKPSEVTMNNDGRMKQASSGSRPATINDDDDSLIEVKELSG